MELTKKEQQLKKDIKKGKKNIRINGWQYTSNQDNTEILLIGNRAHCYATENQLDQGIREYMNK